MKISFTKLTLTSNHGSVSTVGATDMTGPGWTNLENTLQGTNGLFWSKPGIAMKTPSWIVKESSKLTSVINAYAGKVLIILMILQQCINIK